MSEDLLSICLHASTQNNNESLNALVWKHCPKDVFVGIDVLNLGCYSAIINFNDGLNGINRVFEKLYLKPGHYSSSFLASSDLKRVRNMEKNIIKRKKAGESSYEIFVKDFWTKMRKKRVYVMVQENFSLYLLFPYFNRFFLCVFIFLFEVLSVFFCLNVFFSVL